MSTTLWSSICGCESGAKFSSLNAASKTTRWSPFGWLFKDVPVQTATNRVLRSNRKAVWIIGELARLGCDFNPDVNMAYEKGTGDIDAGFDDETLQIVIFTNKIKSEKQLQTLIGLLIIRPCQIFI